MERDTVRRLHIWGSIHEVEWFVINASKWFLINAYFYVLDRLWRSKGYVVIVSNDNLLVAFLGFLTLNLSTKFVSGKNLQTKYLIKNISKLILFNKLNHLSTVLFKIISITDKPSLV